MSKKQRYLKHGLVALKRAMQGHIDPRSKLGLLLADLRMDLVADLGGPKLVTQAQQLVVERVIRAKLRADAGEAWLDEQPIEARLDERVLAIERETRMQGEAMVRWLSLLGLERRKAPMKSLADAWAEKLSAEAQDHDDVEQAPGSEPEAPDKLFSPIPPRLSTSPWGCTETTMATTKSKRKPLTPDLLAFIRDPDVGLGDRSLSPYQETLLRAMKALPCTDEQLAIYREATGRSAWPTKPATEVVVIAGVRSGKDEKIAKPLVLFEAMLGGHEKRAAVGEQVIIPIVAQDLRASDILFAYCRDQLKASDRLAHVIEDGTQRQLVLSNGVKIVCFPAVANALRGWSAPLAVMDEAAFLPRAGMSDSDEDIRTALRTRMTTFPGATLLILTSPYAKDGLVYDHFRRYWGQDALSEDAGVLVWKAPTWKMNPSTADQVERERRLMTPAVFDRECGAEFAEAVEGFLSVALLESAIATGCPERLPVPGVRYFAGVDPSGGRRDAFTLSIAHAEGEQIVQDFIRGWSPAEIAKIGTRGAVKECAEVLRRYKINAIRETTTPDHGSLTPSLSSASPIGPQKRRPEDDGRMRIGQQSIPPSRTC